MIKRSVITQAPLPVFGSLLKGLFSRPVKDRVLSQPWVREGERAYWFSRSAWSLAVVVYWCERIKQKTPLTVWVPDFFCNESLALLRREEIKLVYFPVDEKGYPKMQQLEALAEKESPDLLLMAHYFGRAVLCEEVARFCEQYGAWLIEDAAHVLQPASGIGERGDCVLYSPHKQLAIPDGAVLVVRESGPAAEFVQDEKAQRILQEIIYEMGINKKRENLSSYVWLLKRMLQLIGIRLSSPLPPFECVAPEGGERFSTLPGMSSMAQRLLSQIIPSLSDEAKRRKENATQWQEVIQSVITTQKVDVVTDDYVPYLSIVSTKEQKMANRLYCQLGVADTAVVTWPDLPAEVIDDVSKRKHQSAKQLRHSCMYLPVHSSISHDQIRASGKRLRDEEIASWRLESITDFREWERLWLRCEKKSLPQAWAYGDAKSVAEGWRVQRFAVLNHVARPVALFQVLTKGIPRVAQVARVNRGPVVLSDDLGCDSDAVAINAVAVLARESQRQRWWMMQIAPLLSLGELHEDALRSFRFRKQPIFPMDSALVPLDQDEEQLMMNLKGKWRNMLRKGQKSGVIVKLDQGGRELFDVLIDFYQKQQDHKMFEGTSDAMLKALADLDGESFRFNLFYAYEDGVEFDRKVMLGVVVTLQFGDVSEYLIGVSDERGRAKQANTVLLWEAMRDAKHNGCRWFDVGGLAENTPEGIARFKNGLNPEKYEVIGEWRKWF